MNSGTMTEEQKVSMIGWWASTVGLAFFPTVFSAVISLCIYGSVDAGELIGEGELILCAFLVTAPSIIAYYKKAPRTGFFMAIFCCLLAASLFQLGVYVAIKVYTACSFDMVLRNSLFCVIPSIIGVWQSEKVLEKEVTQ